jgi:hypothetical protein
MPEKFVEVPSSESFREALKEQALLVAEAIIKGNLIIPQTYGAIRTLGTQALIAATVTEDDFSAENIIDALYEYRVEIIQNLVKTAEAAHRPYGVAPKVMGTTDQKKFATLEALFNTHVKVVIDGVKHVLEYIDKTDLSEQDDRTKCFLAVAYLNQIKEALLQADMVEGIKRYKNDVAANRYRKGFAVRELNHQWWNSYAQIASKDDGQILPFTSEEEARALFSLMTNPDEK